MRHALVAVLGCLAAASVTVAADPPLVEKAWKVDGLDRKALIYAPAAATTSDTPLVFAFHGHGGTAVLATSRSMARTIARTPFVVLAIKGGRCSTASFISDTM